MTEEMLKAVFDTAQAKPDDDGGATLPEGKTMTLYAAHEGVSLTVTKVVSAKVTHGVVRARNSRGETFLVSIEDLYAAAVDGASEPSATRARKAGFLS